MRHGLQWAGISPLWLAGLNIGWDYKTQWIVGSQNQYEFPPFFKCHWQSPSTALKAGKWLPLGLCKETVKESISSCSWFPHLMGSLHMISQARGLSSSGLRSGQGTWLMASMKPLPCSGDGMPPWTQKIYKMIQKAPLTKVARYCHNNNALAPGKCGHNFENIIVNIGIGKDHYLNQCWARSPMPYGFTKPHLVKPLAQFSFEIISAIGIWACGVMTY